MGDTGDDYKVLKEYNRDRRRTLGINCPGCQKKFPKAHPKILMPGQKCFCGYRDTRIRKGD